MKKWLSAFIRDEEGASGIEYALVAAMVAVALVTFIEPINKVVGRIFSDIKETLEKVSPGP